MLINLSKINPRILSRHFYFFMQEDQYASNKIKVCAAHEGSEIDRGFEIDEDPSNDDLLIGARRGQANRKTEREIVPRTLGSGGPALRGGST